MIVGHLRGEWHVRNFMAHLALLIPDMSGGGAERVALTLIDGFLKAGHRVDLLVLRSIGALLDHVPTEVRTVELGGKRYRNAISPLKRYLQAERPIGLLAMMWPMPVIAVIAKYLARCNTRVIASDHAILTEHYRDQPARLAALRLTTSIFYRLCDGRATASASIADDLSLLSGIPKRSFQAIPNPIGLPERLERAADVDQLWRGIGPRILTVGSLKPEKDHQFLLRAFAQLPARLEASLVILGDGPLRGELQALATRLGIADQVAMPGFRADPWPFYASADLFVLTSTSEGFGNVVVEALAAGLPVVSTDCAGPREVLGGGEYGDLTSPGDVDALVVAMVDAIEATGDAELRKSRARQYRPELAIGRYLRLLTGAT